ncbi:MAG: hypothetical protein ACE5DS_03585 [Kiloniellaceae bacterium]
MKRLLLGMAFSMALVAPAFAFHCPTDMADVDAALSQGPSLSAAQLAEVKQLRAEGEKLHKAGKHQAAVDTLAKAKAILGIM